MIDPQLKRGCLSLRYNIRVIHKLTKEAKKMNIKYMTIEQVQKGKKYIQSLLDGYQRHNIHGCYNDLIQKNREMLKRCDKQIKLLKYGGVSDKNLKTEKI